MSPTLKSFDERGWFCDAHFTAERVLNTFAENGWTLHSMYESQAVVPGKGGFQVASTMIFYMEIKTGFCELLFFYFSRFLFFFFFFYNFLVCLLY